MTTILTTFKIRRDTAANWTATNPVLAEGEPGLETDTRKIKWGDGSTAWNSLGYEYDAAGSGLADGDYGDITASGSGTTLTIDNGVVTLAKMANMATASLIYRKTAGSGAPEVNTLATLKTDLGLTGTNSGDQTFTITGDGTAAGSTSSLALTVTKLNGVSLAGLGTGILKNTTGTGAPSIAVAGDFPTLNQNTTGSAATLTTPRAIYGNNFDGSAALTQVIASSYGGTGNGFTKFTGPATAEKTFTLPNASETIATLGQAQTFSAAQTFINSSGIKIQDTDASHTLGIVGGSNLTANRTLTLTTGDASRTLTLSGNADISGTNTGDQTSVTGNAGTATALQTPRTINGVSFDGTGNITINAVDSTARQPLDATLTALAAFNTNGFLTQTAADTFTGRTLTAGSGKISISNGNGVSGNPTVDLGSVASTDLSDSASLYKSGGTDVALADGGTGASLTDPNADRVMFWDDSAGAVTWLTMGTNLSITGTTLNASGGGSLGDGDYGDIVVSGSGTVLSIDSGVATTFGRSLMDDADASAGRTTLGLGTAATQNTGTSGANVPLMNGANTWSANQSFTGRLLPTQTSAAAATLHIVNDFYMQALFESSSSAGGFGMKNSGGYQYEFQCDPGNRLLYYDRSAAEYRLILDSSGNITLPAAFSSSGLSYRLGVVGTGYFSGDLRLAANLLMQDTDDSHYTTITLGSNLTANRTLTITTGDADRTLTFTGNASITGTNTGDQTSIVGITGTLAQFNTAITDADIPNMTSVTGLAGAIGPTIADYFSSTLSLDASSTYEITCHAYFLKTTAGTVTWTWNFSSAPTMASSRNQSTPITGFTTSTITGAEVFSEATAEAVAAMAHAASGSLTTAVRHSFMFTLLVRTNAATTLQLRATESAGTITPQAGSYMSARKVA